VTAVAAFNENDAAVGTKVADFSAHDEEDGTPSVGFTAGTNTDGYYAISGSTVVLTQAGVDAINAGKTLPAVSLTATDSGNLTATDSETPTYYAQNDAPTIAVTAVAAFNENDAAVGTKVADFSAHDEEDGTPSVGFTAGTNTDGYYAISGSTVVLTQAGVDAINAGKTLPAVSLTATDSGNLTATDSETPTYYAQNDAPIFITANAMNVVEGEDSAIGILEGASGIYKGNLLLNLLATDEDDSTLYLGKVNGVTVDPTNGYDTTIIFNYTDKNGNLASITTALHVNQDGSFVLSNVSDLNPIPAGVHATASLNFNIRDDEGAQTATAKTINLSIIGDNDAPVAVADTLSATEDKTIIFNASDLLGNDTDVDSAHSSLHIASVTSGHNGTAVLNADGTVTFTPNANFSGTADFTYTTTDGTAISNSATVTINVAAVADAPTVSISGTGIVSEAINVSNASTTGNGFTITAYNADGTKGIISTHSDSPIGFGVSGTASNGDSTELGHSGTGSETLDVKFDNAITSMNVSFAWLNSTESYGVYFYLNGVLVGTTTSTGGNDNVDAAVTLSPSNGSSFNEVIFYAPNANDDYLINSITFDREIPSISSVTADNTRSVELNVSSALSDTDGSETLATKISGLPTGFFLTDGTHTAVSTSATALIDISTWNLATLTLTAPENVYGTVTLSVQASSTETSNHTTATTTSTIDVVIAQDVTAIGVADHILTNVGNNTSYVIPEWALLYNDTSADDVTGVAIVNNTLTTANLTSASGYVTVQDNTSSGFFTYTASDIETNAHTGSSSTLSTASNVAVDISRSTTGNTLTGTSANEILIGKPTASTLNGGDGDDILIGGSSSDTLNGGAGNDVIVYGGFNTKIDGGTGTDTLVLKMGTDIDFSALNTANDPIKNMEVIDLTINGNHTLTALSLSDVLDVTGKTSNATLSILGDSADKVTVDSTLSKTGTSTEVVNGAAHTFDIYAGATDPTVIVKIEQVITHS